MVLEGVASSILSHFLSKYIHKLDTKDIKMSIFSGKVALDNLEIKETALMEHQIPFRVEKGTIKCISASIPYTKLKTAPCKAAIDEIYVLGTLAGKVLIQADSNTNNSKDIPEEYSELDAALQNENATKTDFTSGVVGSIIDNIQVLISNIHIRLEYQSGNRTVAIGIIIPLIKLYSIDESGNAVDVNQSKTFIRKKLVLSNLSIYVDTNCEQITEGIRKNTIDFSREMDKLSKIDHQYILHNSTFEVIYEHFKEGSGPTQFGNILNITTRPINLSIDMLQYRCFNKLHNENIKFNRKRFYASCGRPDDYPKEERNNESIMWFHFLTRSAYKKNHPFNFNPQKALIFLKNRTKTLTKLSQILKNPNPKKDEKYLLKLQEKYGGDVFLMFRAYAKTATENQLREEKKKKSEKNKLEIQSNELQEILSQKDFIKNNSDAIGIKFKLEEINVLLSFNEKKPLLLLQWKNWQGLIEKNKSDISIDAQIGDLLLINKKSPDLTNIITMNQSKATKGNSVLLHVHGNIMKKFFDVDCSLASPQFYLDMPMIYDISHFFKSTSDISREEKVPKTKKRDMTDLEVDSLFENHVTLLLNVHLETPVAKIPYKQPIIVSIGNIDIKSVDTNKRKMSLTDVDSWYDKYAVNITGFNASMNDKVICQPINFNLDMNHTFIRRNSTPMLKFAAKISSIDFDLNREQYCLLLQFPEFLKNEAIKATQIEGLIQDPQEEKVNNNTLNQPFNLDDFDFSFLFNLLFDQISLNLINSENQKCCNAKIRGIKCGIKAIQNSIISNFLLQNLAIQSKDHEIVSFGDSKEDAIKANLLMQKIDINASLQTARPIITVDVDWIMKLFNFFNPPQELFKFRDSKIQSGISVISSYFNSVAFSIINPKKELNDYQITRLLKTHPNIKVDINCTAPKVFLPIRNSAFTANLGSIHIYTKDPLKREISNVDSYYDRFVIELDNFEILGDDNEHLLNPFSTSIEIDKSFVSLSKIHEVKALININDFTLEIKQRHFQSIMTIVDQFMSLYFTMTDKISMKSLETITDYKSNDSLNATKTKSTHLYGFEQLFLSSERILSFLIDLKFQNLQISLLNEDRSVHSSFVMNQLQTTVNSLNNIINADIKIVKLTASSGSETLISFGKENVECFNCNLNIVNKAITADFIVSEPTINLNFNKIFQLVKFIEIPIETLVFLVNNIEEKLNYKKLKKESFSDLSQSLSNDKLPTKNLDVQKSSSFKKKNNLKVTGKLNKIKVKSPVLYKKLQEMLEIEINCEINITEVIQVNVSSLTARFNDVNGFPHPPFISELSANFSLESNVIAISTNPSQTLITVALDDIASVGVFVNSLLKFITSLKSSQIKLNTKSNKKVDMNQFTLSTEIYKLQFQLNSDRFQTVPLFRFCLKQLNFIYTLDRLSRSDCQFDSIDFMDLEDFKWKMLVEPFSANIELCHTISEESGQNNIQLNVSISDPININFAYSAVQMILKYSKMVLRMISSKEELKDKPPFFKVQNISSETIIIKDKDQKILDKVDPNCLHELKIKKDDEVEITIGDVTKKIVTSQLHYPVFFTNRSVLSHKMSESGTTLLASSVLLFDNQTEYPLYLLKSERMWRFSNVMCISSNEQKPMEILDDLRTAQFALTTEESLTNASHNTFTIKSIKKAPILLECIFPDNRKIKLVVSCKFNSLSCSMIVKIEPNCVIKNQLPVELVVRPSGQHSTLRIKEGDMIKTTTIDATQGEFYGHFAAGSYSYNQLNMSDRLLVKTKDGTFSPIDLAFIPYDTQSTQIAYITVKASLNPNKPQTNLIFYAPALIYNRSGFNLGCSYLEDGRMTRISQFSPREKGCNPCDDGFAFWSTKEFFLKNDDKRLPLTFFVTGKDQKIYVDDDTIECTVAHIDGPIMIPTTNPDLFYPLHYTIASAEPFSASKLVTVTAQCLITNMTQKSFYIQPVIPNQAEENNSNNKGSTENWKFGDLVEIKSGTKMEKIEIASMSLLFAFKIDSNSKSYSILNFSEPTHTTFALDGQIFEIETQALKVEMLITVKDALFPQPLNLLNDLEIECNENVYITQTSSDQAISKDKIWKSEANPQTMTVVAYDNPFGGTDITLHYQKEEIPINLIAVNSPCKYKDIYYEVITNQNNTKTIVVSRKPWKLTEKKNKLDLHLDISKINFVIIDKYNHEFCLLRLQYLIFSYSTTGEFNLVQFKLRTLQLDDLQPSSVLKVVAAGIPEEEKDKDGNPNYFIDFSISMFPNAPFLTACQEISLKIEPIVVFLDISFLTDSISLLQTMFVIENSESFLLAKPKPSEPSSLNSIPLTAKSLTINEINVTLFVRSTSSRPILYKTSFSFLKAIPDITNGQINLPSFHFEDCTMNAAYIEKDIVKPIINAGISQCLKLLFHTDIFMRSTGTRSANFARKGERLMNGELQVLIQVPGSIILQGGESFANVFSKVAHMTAFDNKSSINRVNTTAKDTMVSGMKALGNGFVDGISGIVTQPMKMGQESGIGGAFVGFGKGLIGLVARPVAGVLDAGVASFAAVRKKINGEDEDVIPPMRCARALPMIQLKHFTENMMKIKDVAQLHFQLSDIESLYNQWVEMYVNDPNASVLLGITRNYLFLSDENGEMTDYYKIRKIVDVQFDQPNSTIKIVVRKSLRNREITINVKYPYLGFRITQLINSRRIPLGIGE